MMDFVIKNLGWVVLGLIAVLILAMLVSHHYTQVTWSKGMDVIQTKGYDRGDVNVFLNSFDYDPDDFLKSSGLRKQYEQWSSGKNMLSERKSVMAKHAAEEAKSSANVAIGMSAAAIGISSSNH